VIPLSEPDISVIEMAYVVDALQSTYISSTGPFVDRFEADWARACGAEHAVTVTNGTAALEVTMRALGAQRGDEVVVPAFTFAAVAGAVASTGATPVYADVDPDTWCIDAAAVASVITPRTVGILAVHGYGHPAPMSALLALAGRHALWVVEDGAEAHLARLHGRPVGGLGHAAAFSFFGNKVIAAGEGGAVTTSDPALAATIRTLANQGVPAGASDRYAPARIGSNLRLTNVACALLCAQLERADLLLARRRAVESAYRDRLALRWRETAEGAEPVPWLVTAMVDDRDAVLARLHANGIQARRSFPAICDLEPYRVEADVPVARALAAKGLSLPTFPGLSETDLDRVVHAVAAACQPAAASVR
jgi:perosamine synthetase